MSYHEVETYNGDSNTIVTEEPSCTLKTLLPGRNYSITVQAVSNQMDSNETSIYQATSKYENKNNETSKDIFNTLFAFF